MAAGMTTPSVVKTFDVDFSMPGDYDGDGKTDFAGGRIENGRLVWRVLFSSNNFVEAHVGHRRRQTGARRLRRRWQNRSGDFQAERCHLVHIPKFRLGLARTEIRHLYRYSDTAAECVLMLFFG